VGQVVESLPSKCEALSLTLVPPRKKERKKEIDPGTLVVHDWNPSYSRGRDQEDHGLKPARENSLQDPI
jgi:hypothetical protein